jgi:hypothetical protein
MMTFELNSQACSLGPPLRKLGGPTAWGPVLKNGSSFHGVGVSDPGDPQPDRLVNFSAACPCPDVLMQDGTQKKG